MKGTAVNPALYYRLTWQLQIALASGLLIMADVTRIAIALPFLAMSLLLTSSFGAGLKRWHRVMRIAIGAGMLAEIGDLVANFQGFESIVEALIGLITGALPLLLMNVESPRSYWLATLNLSVIAVGSIAFAAGPGLYFGFVMFMVLLLFNLNAANIYLPDAGGLRLNEALPPGYFRQFLYVMPIGLIAAALIFVIFPRARSLSFGFNLGLKPRTGYTGVISLEGGGEIETTEEVAFLAKTRDLRWLDVRKSHILFRGDALDKFDGKRWSSSALEYVPKSQVHDLRSVRSELGRTRELRIVREPTRERTIFYSGVLVSVNQVSSGFGDIQVNSSGTLMRQRETHDAQEYSLRVSDLPKYPELARRPLRELVDRVFDPTDSPTLHTPDPQLLRANLAIPDEVGKAKYFSDWVDEIGVAPDRDSLVDVVGRVRSHFRERFTTSLANEFSDANALAAFLSKDRRGHCEYFASATALYFRALGVPARVVVGYRGGTVNPLIEMLEVREGNAHAWAEVYVPSSGWYPVDLTPVAISSDGSSLASIRLYANALSFWFRQYVVDYNFETQQSLVNSLRDIANSDAEAEWDWRALLKAKGLRIGVGLIVVGGIMFVLVRRRRRRRDALVPPYYARFALFAGERGMTRAAGETYAAFHARIKAAGIEPDLVDAVDSAYEREVYGDSPLAREAQARLLLRIDDARAVSRRA